jgi:uncharacterized Ntn-hydrolase superfamily protein
MTYTIMAQSPAKGEIGIASGTCTINCSRFHMPLAWGLMPRFERNGALLMPQASSSYQLPFNIRRVVEAGGTFDDVHEALSHDPNYLISQVGIIRADGDMWAYTGPDCLETKMHLQDDDYIVLGNALAGKHVFAAMESAFRTSQGEPLCERLMRALEAGRDAGGQQDPKYGHLPELWAMLQVFDGRERPSVDLRVDYDYSADAVGTLRRLMDDIVPLGSFYDTMVADPDAFHSLWLDEAANLEMQLYWRDRGSA